MPWRTPPPDVQARVQAELGDRIWQQLAASWANVVKVAPELNVGQPGAYQWYRSPQEAVLAHRRRPTVAALYTQHGVGLAIDVTPSPAHRAAVISAAKQAGFYVRSDYSDRHLHVAALSDAAWARSRLKSWLAARVNSAQRALESGL